MSQSKVCFLINKFDVLTNKNIKIIRLFKKDIFKVVTFKKFVRYNKVVIFEEISSNI